MLPFETTGRAMEKIHQAINDACIGSFGSFLDLSHVRLSADASILSPGDCK